MEIIKSAARQETKIFQELEFFARHVVSVKAHATFQIVREGINHFGVAMRPDRTFPAHPKAARIFSRQNLAAWAQSEIHRVECLQDRIATVTLANQQPRVVGIE